MNDHRSVIVTMILDALTHGPAPNAPVTAFRLLTERLSHDYPHSIKKAENPNLEVLVGRDSL